MVTKLACIILAVALGWSIKDGLQQRQQMKNLQQGIINFNKANQVTASCVNEIREKIKYVKEDCNCYNAPIPDAIIDRVHHN